MVRELSPGFHTLAGTLDDGVLLLCATEAAFIDTSLCISEIVEVHSYVLVDLLAVLAVMFNVVAPSSTLEGLPVVVVLVGEATLAAIGSCRG